jgi:hypothetical protein
MVLHGTIPIIIPRAVMGKPHVIMGGITRREGIPHIMVLLAVERMAIASLTTGIRLNASSLHLKATLLLVGSLLTLEVMTLRSARVANRTGTTTVRDKTTKGNHRGMNSTSIPRNTTRNASMITATIASNQIGNMSMAIVTTIHNAVPNAIKAEGTRASMKGQ